MRRSLAILCLAGAPVLLAQEAKPKTSPPAYDAALAERLGADERGMRSYVLVLLKTGPKADLPKAESDKLFSGHMANIGRLAGEGKLIVAGPMVKNDHHYEGVFVFTVKTVKEAEALLATDPAVAAGALAYEAYGWYTTAALMEALPIHYKIDKTAR